MSNSPQPPPNTVHGDVIVDLDANGMVSVWTISGWMWVRAEDVEELAATASATGHLVTVGGDIDAALCWPVADRLATVAGATPSKIEGDHPLGWMSVAGLDEHPENPAAIELVERAQEVGETASLLRAAARWCRPRAYDVLRRASGAEPTPVPADASEAAVSIPYPTHQSRWVAGVLAAAFLALIVGGLVADGGFDGNPVAAAVIVVVVAAVIYLIGFGSKHRAVCFDDSRLWVRAGRDRWHGPVDLRNLGVYYERPGRRGALFVVIGEPDPEGQPVRPGDSFDREARKRIEASDRRYRLLRIPVDTTYLMDGLGAYIAPYVDPERCLVGLSRHVLRRTRTWAPREYDDVPTHRPPA